MDPSKVRPDTGPDVGSAVNRKGAKAGLPFLSAANPPDAAGASPVTIENAILTAKEVATELRCSRAHVYKLMKGEVAGLSKLPAIIMGRKYIFRRKSFEAWKEANESTTVNGTLPGQQEMNAVAPRNQED